MPSSKLSRRQFLHRSAFGVSACATLPTFLAHALASLDARAQSFPPSGQDGPILIIMQLAGGNDSLNTVIPYTNSIYTSARNSLVLGTQHGVRTLGAAAATGGGTEEIALHPALANVKRLWDNGEVAVVNGVGYPNPNLSHFTSFDYWHTAQPGQLVRDGWLGRFFDHECSGCASTNAIDMSDNPTLAFRHNGLTDAHISISDPALFQWRDLPTSDRRLDLEANYRQLIGLDHPTDRGIAATDPTLAYVQRTAHNAMLSSAAVQQSMALAGTGTGFPRSGVAAPNNSLGRDFRDVASLIYGGSRTNIYYLHQGGYDTHNNQVTAGSPATGTHANLLTTLDGALGWFRDEMVAQGIWNRVVLFTFSEFGRKVIQNGSTGTDHGAAASLFVMGGRVNPGFYGAMPDLAAQARVSNNSMAYNLDFRRIYRTMLTEWLGTPASALGEILPGGSFASLPLIRST